MIKALQRWARENPHKVSGMQFSMCIAAVSISSFLVGASVGRIAHHETLSLVATAHLAELERTERVYGAALAERNRTMEMLSANFADLLMGQKGNLIEDAIDGQETYEKK